MTEADWLIDTDFTALALFAAERLSPRRLRLLAAAFCRAGGPLLNHPTLTDALAVIERYADGADDAGALVAARQECRELAQRANDSYRTQVDGATDDRSRASVGVNRHVLIELSWAIAYAASSPVPVDEIGTRVANAAVEAVTGVVLLVPEPGGEFGAAHAEQKLRMRAVVWEVVGNPFRSVDFAPWRTGTAVSLARQMYEASEFGAMPILADALQDAGCDNEDVLNHCREPGEHVRGCWVVDGVLGKE